MAKKKKSEEISLIDVVRWEGDKIHVLRHATIGEDYSYIHESSQIYHSIHNSKTGEIIEEDSFRCDRGLDLIMSIALSLAGVGIPLLFYELRKTARENRRKTTEYFDNLRKFGDKNMADLREAVKDIKIYQGTINEVSQDLGKKLERIDTKKPETFIRAKNDFWLNVKAYCLGADAIVHYQPGSSLGTPVRFKKE